MKVAPRSISCLLLLVLPACHDERLIAGELTIGPTVTVLEPKPPLDAVEKSGPNVRDLCVEFAEATMWDTNGGASARGSPVRTPDNRIVRVRFALTDSSGVRQDIIPQGWVLSGGITSVCVRPTASSAPFTRVELFSDGPVKVKSVTWRNAGVIGSL